VNLDTDCLAGEDGTEVNLFASWHKTRRRWNDSVEKRVQLLR
jgi:hypothetical protein